MATVANPIRKIISYKRESTWGTLPSATSAKELRRVSGNFNLTKETYDSAEVRSDQQTAVSRHGTRSVTGSLNGELSAGSYSEFLSAILAQDFTAGVSLTGATFTIAANGTNYDITRAAGSYLTDGIKIGDVVRLTGAALNANNTAKNLLVLSVTATVATVKVLNGSTMTVESSKLGDMAVAGKKTYVPTSGHTNVSYSIEQWYSDIPAVEVYTGCKVQSAAVSLPSSGFSTINFAFMGKDLGQTGSSRYYTSPTSAGTTAGLAAVNGALVIDGVAVGLLTSVDFTIAREQSALNVVGSNTAADVTSGRITVSGSFNAYFTDVVYRDKFVNETEAALTVALTADNTANSDVVVFNLPRIKVNSATANDDTKGIVQTFNFTALLNANGGTGTSSEKTTISVQDTAA